MAKLATATLALTLLALSTTAAEARRGGGVSGWYEDLHFVAETQIPGEALCHLVKRHHVFWLPITTESRGYALAENRCDAESYAPLEAADIQWMRETGIIAADIPDVPAVSMNSKIQNWLVYGVGALLVLVAIFAKGYLALGGGTRRRQRKVGKQVVPMLAAMCHVAKCDGEIAQGEVATIQMIVKRITGRNVTAEQVMEMINATEDNFSLSDYAALGQDLDIVTREAIFEAALTVAVSDGKLDPAEYNVVRDLATGLQISGDTFRATLRSIAGNLSPA